MMLPSLLLALVLSLAGDRDDGRESIKILDVPGVVHAASSKAVPNVTWTKATRERVGERTIYELSGKNARGRNITVVALDDGEVTDVATQVLWSEVPPAARDSLQAHLPGFRTGDIALCVSHIEIRMIYVFEGTADGKRVTVNVDPDGSHFSSEFESASPP
jgi:hypothetical protein